MISHSSSRAVGCLVLAACLAQRDIAITAQSHGIERPLVGLRQAGHGAPIPTATKQVLPYYSPEAAAAGVKGLIELETAIDTDGRVTQARLVSELHDGFGLDKAAVEAVRQWRFRHR